LTPRQGAEYVDRELMPLGVERQNLQRPGSKNACVVDQEIKADTAQRVGYARSPGSHSVLFGDVADRQADAPQRPPSDPGLPQQRAP
jgi:hypothetical protein